MALSSINIPAAALTPDNDAQLVAGDTGARLLYHLGRIVYAFDDTAEEAVVSQYYKADGWAGGTLTVDMFCYMESATSGDVDMEVFVESVTPDSDTLDLEAAESFSTVNEVAAGTNVPATAGNGFEITVTISAADSIADGDYFRIGIRRDTDDADDAATGDLFLASVVIREA